MGRRRTHRPLRTYLNNRHVGTLNREPGGAITFAYHAGWLDVDNAIPVSLSLPLREMPYRGAAVAAVFENLLPDYDPLRRLIAERVGAQGTDAWSLLSVIGRDCVGALQFVPEDEDVPDSTGEIEGETLDDAAIDHILKHLGRAPLGLAPDDGFRISVAGAQEKTAFLRHDGNWIRPYGTTPTTHIFKPPIGALPGGIDLSNSVENEYFCLRLAASFGIPVNTATIETFGETKTLVIERFDRRRTAEGRLLRLPQEDCCQALSIPPTLKYEDQGGPGINAILELLRGSDTPLGDQAIFLKAQIVFWLIGATDGHAKNFSLFLSPGGRFRMTPLYDILTAQPALDAGQIDRRQMRMAMAVGRNRYYRFDKIMGRHFVQTAALGGFSEARGRQIVTEIADTALDALDTAATALPSNFPSNFIEHLRNGIQQRRNRLALLE